MTTVGEHMSPAPHPVGVEQTLDVAAGFMRKHGVKHLPVLHGGEIVGALSARDLAMPEAADDTPLSGLKVEDVMTDEPYVVTPDTPLHEVLAGMVERQVGSVMVAEGEKLVGIFTATDAVRILAEKLAP
jgi:acetoin utilization protein AcuB